MWLCRVTVALCNQRCHLDDLVKEHFCSFWIYPFAPLHVNVHLWSIKDLKYEKLHGVCKEYNNSIKFRLTAKLFKSATHVEVAYVSCLWWSLNKKTLQRIPADWISTGRGPSTDAHSPKVLLRRGLDNWLSCACSRNYLVAYKSRGVALHVEETAIGSEETELVH